MATNAAALVASIRKRTIDILLDLGGGENAPTLHSWFYSLKLTLI
jgi:hypothetical protein